MQNIDKLESQHLNSKSTVKLGQGRNEKATAEHVLDPRTRMVLFKLLSKGILYEITGCVSTGKEAHVYVGKAGPHIYDLKKKQKELRHKTSRPASTPDQLISDSHLLPPQPAQVVDPRLDETLTTSQPPFTQTDKRLSSNHASEEPITQFSEEDSDDVGNDHSNTDGGYPHQSETPIEPAVDNQLMQFTQKADSPTSESFVLVAIKIFKTCALSFKDRDRYVTGEFRFRKGYSKKNSRKMVSVWAEKEFRNLYRLYDSGIECPKPLLLRENVIIMSFYDAQKKFKLNDQSEIKQDSLNNEFPMGYSTREYSGWPAPRLKDAKVSAKKWPLVYLDCVKIMRKMYQKAKLVHSDFSEYNILYWNQRIVVIDVGQAVEHDHPHALEFLRRDCFNITDFFGRVKQSLVLDVQTLFMFVTDLNFKSELDETQFLDDALLKAKNTNTHDPQKILAEALFMQSFIPRTLDEVYDHERDIDRVTKGDTNDLYYLNVTGIAPIEDLSATDEKVPSSISSDEEPNQSQQEDSTKSDEDSTQNIDSSLENDSSNSVSEEPDAEELKRLKKERKAKVKLEKREKRKTKIPKKVKKRKVRTKQK